jgi:hypothetical protein
MSHAGWAAWTGLLIDNQARLNPTLWRIWTVRRTTQQLSITLPNEMADAVKTKVRTGEYASESEVIRDDLSALLSSYRAVESWLLDQVGPPLKY